MRAIRQIGLRQVNFHSSRDIGPYVELDIQAIVPNETVDLTSLGEMLAGKLGFLMMVPELEKNESLVRVWKMGDKYDILVMTHNLRTMNSAVELADGISILDKMQEFGAL